MHLMLILMKIGGSGEDCGGDGEENDKDGDHDDRDGMARVQSVVEMEERVWWGWTWQRNE